MEKQGYVYILTNPSFKEDWVKIGKSSRPVDIRSKELDNTAVPLPFEIFATLQTTKFNQVEKLIHKTIDRLTDLRIRQNREFFNVSPQMALSILQDIATTLDDAVIKEYINGQCVGDEEVDDETISSKPRARFKFSMIGVPIGAIVLFTPTNIEVKVASDDQVEYEGRLYKLSPFVGTFMPENKRNTSGAYQGAKYFTYNGEVLATLRDKSGYDFYDSSNNNDKYNYDGNIYGKGTLVNAVIRDYVFSHQDITYTQLESVFFRKLQGSNGCFDLLEKAKEIEKRDRRRHHINSNQIITLSDCIIATSTQWGRGNINNFLTKAAELGFTITVIEQ